MPSKERILLIAYDPDVLKWAKEQALEPAGYQLQVVHAVEEAIPVLAQQPLDLIIVDLHLPGLGGKDLVAALQAQGLDIPVVLIAREGEEERILQVLRIGARDFVLYPTREAELVNVVERNLNQARLKHQIEEWKHRVQQARQETRTRERQLLSLGQLAKSVMELPKLSVLLPRAMREVAIATNANRSWLAVRAPKQPTLRLVAYYNLPANFVEQARQRWQDGVSSLVLLSGETLVLDHKALQRFPLRALGKAAILTPIKRGLEAFAILGVLRTRDHPFTPDDQLVLEIAAGMLAGALVAGGMYTESHG